MNAPLKSNSALRQAAVKSLIRAVLAHARAAKDKSQIAQPEELLAQSWPDDYLAHVLVRSAVSPPTLSSVTNILAQVVPAFIEALRPLSAAADLISMALNLTWDRAAQLWVPTMTIPLGGFVGAGLPFPAQQGVTTLGAVLDPYKIGLLITLTSEMIRYSAAEAVVREVLLANSGGTLDSLLFDSNPAVPELRPAGLLHGVTPLTAATGGGDDAMTADLQSLIGSVAPVSGNADVVFVCAAQQALAIALRAGFHFDYDVLSSAQLAPGTVIAIVPRALAVAADIPAIEASAQAVLTPDTAGLPIVNGGAPAPQVVSLFQTDSIGLRLRWPISWMLRDSRALAVVTNTTW